MLWLLSFTISVSFHLFSPTQYRTPVNLLWGWLVPKFELIFLLLRSQFMHPNQLLFINRINFTWQIELGWTTWLIETFQRQLKRKVLNFGTTEKKTIHGCVKSWVMPISWSLQGYHPRLIASLKIAVECSNKLQTDELSFAYKLI